MHFTDITGIITETESNDGGTWSISFSTHGRIMVTANPFEYGYYVAINNSLTTHMLTPELVAQFIRDSAHELTVGQPRCFLGTWVNEDKTYLELVRHFDNLTECMEFAQQNAQHSIWDIQASEEITVADYTARLETLQALSWTGGTPYMVSVPYLDSSDSNACETEVREDLADDDGMAVRLRPCFA